MEHRRTKTLLKLVPCGRFSKIYNFGENRKFRRRPLPLAEVSLPLQRFILIEVAFMAKAPRSFFLSCDRNPRQSISKTDFLLPSQTARTSLVTVSKLMRLRDARIRLQWTIVDGRIFHVTNLPE